MKMLVVPPQLGAAMVAVLLLAGCSGPIELTELSQHSTASWSDIAVGQDGVLHVVFTEAPRGGNNAIYYRSSKDKGATWSASLNLTEDARDRTAGRPEVVVDEQGRVYVLWKSMKADERDSLRGSAYGAPLVARVLSGGTWSQTIPVSPHSRVRSWFLAVDPTGGVQTVWSENLVAPDGGTTIFAAVIAHAKLSGTTVSAPTDLVRKPATAVQSYHYDEYEGLRGYVDASGRPHFTATRLPAREGEEKSEVVYFDGTTDRMLFNFGNYGYYFGYYGNMPELLVDAKGKEHILIGDARGDRKRVLDFDPAAPGTPVVVREAPVVEGELRTFQAVQGTDGRLAALMTFRDGAEFDVEYDLWVSTYENGKWSTAQNVTRNADRGEYKESGDQRGPNGTRVSVSYKPNHASGVFDEDGELNLSLVNMEVVSASINDTGSGVVGNPKVFFGKL